MYICRGSGECLKGAAGSLQPIFRHFPSFSLFICSPSFSKTVLTRIQSPCFHSMDFTYLRKGAHIVAGLVSEPLTSFCWLLQAEETHLSAGAESAREWNTSPQCSFGPPCPFWGRLLAEATGKHWQSGWYSPCHNSVSPLCLALLGTQEREKGPSDVKCPCPQRVRILIIKHPLVCPFGAEKAWG